MNNKSYFLTFSKFFVYLAPFTVLIVTRSTLFPFIVGKYFFFRVIVELALICFLWAWARGETRINADKNADKRGLNIRENPRINPRESALWRQPIVIAVSIFTLIFLLAGFLGYSPSASFWSNFERGEGVFQMLHLFVFFVLMVFLFKDERSWHKMLVIFLWAAGLMIAYGVLAFAGFKLFFTDNSSAGFCGRFAGSLGNSAYVGTYMIFALFFAAILLSRINDKSKIWLKWVLSILLVLFFLILIFSQTRGALMGLGIGIISGLIYLFFHLPKGLIKKIILTTIIILIVLGGLGFKFRRSIDLMPFCKGGGNRILDVSVSAETFQTRLLLWKQALIITKERPILGWGPENFSPAFEKHYLPQFEVWFDRAHNIFLDYLAQTGILGLLSYLSIFVIFYWQFFRKTRFEADKYKAEKRLVTNYRLLITNTLFFALPVAYLVQGLVLFEVLPIYISIFVFLAFANYRFNKQL
jgi:O-antigen ligase